MKFIAIVMLWGLVLFLLTFALWFSFHAARADALYEQNTPQSVSAAALMAPANASYHALLAEHLESAGQSPEPQLLAAIALSPLNSLNLMRLAVYAESQRDYAKAERYLQRAADVDRKFAPRSALLNFYFRRGDDARFWIWTRSALEMSADADTAAMFRLAWEQSQDASLILSHLPPGKKTLARYLSFLIGSQRFGPATAVARRLAVVADAEDTPLLLGFSERVLSVDSAAAVEVWNALAARKLIPLGPLDPAHGEIVSNKDFLVLPEPRGFDWRIPSVEGVYVSQAGDGHGISVHFSGIEPEDCEVLTQIMPLAAGSQFQLGYEFSVVSGQPFGGLHWEVTANGAVLAASPELSAENEWKGGQFTFKASGGSARLSLRYHRPAGRVLAEGILVIRKLSDRVVK